MRESNLESETWWCCCIKVGETGPFSPEGQMHQAAATKSSAFDNLARNELEVRSIHYHIKYRQSVYSEG